MSSNFGTPHAPSACSSEFEALTFDGPVTSISFSPDSTRFAVLSEGQVVGFKVNEDKTGIFQEFQISSDYATTFCWDSSPEPVILVAFAHKPITAFDVISKEPTELDSVVYPEVTAMTCATLHGKDTIILGSGKLLLFIVRKPGEPGKSIDLDAQFNRYKERIDVGWVKKLEIKDGNLAVLTANNKVVTAFGVVTRHHPDLVFQPWPVEDCLAYGGSIALCSGGNSFITGRKNGEIYAADCYSLNEIYNHPVVVFEEKTNVHAVSVYPSVSKYNIFSVAGDADTIRFFTKDDIKNTFQGLEEYTIPVACKSKTAYNASTGKLVNRNSKANSFNPFRDSHGTNPSVVHTVFSPNGQYFAYATTEGFIGILNFKLLDPESSMIKKDEKKRADDEYWEKLALGASEKMPGTREE